MPNRIVLKKNTTAGNSPLAADLVPGEVAINSADGAVYTKLENGTVITLVTANATALSVARGGTGATTLTGYVYGNGTSAMTASTTIPGSAISGSITGSAATLTTARTLTIGGTGKTFDGSAAVSWSLAEIGVPSRAAFPANNESTLDAADIRTLTNPTTGLGYAGGMRVRFSSLNDDNLQPWADVIDLSTYTDNTGGGFNALYLGKNSQLIQHKYAAAAGTSWTTKTLAYTDSNITGTAANVTGTVAVANGGTGSTTQAGARTGLGATTVGANLFTLANPSAITFLRVNADNTVSALDAATFRTAIGAGTSSTTGTVTSVGGTGTVSGLTLSGTVTSSGNLTLGGTLSLTSGNVTTALGYTPLSSAGGTITGNLTVNGSVTAAATLPGYSATGYQYTTVLEYYWTKIANLANKGDSHQALLITAKTDVNYVPYIMAVLSLSSWNNSTHSVKLDGLTSIDIPILVRVDNSGDVWLRVDVAWSSYVSWRVISTTGASMLFASPFTQQIATPANSVEIACGQQVRGNQSAMSSATPANAATHIFGSVSSRGDMYVGASTVVHAGNVGTYALPISGGTMTGAITFAGGQTWPTFNQNTTGSAATLTTTRTIWGQNFNGSANVSGALSGATTIDASGNITTSAGKVRSGAGATGGAIMLEGNYSNGTLNTVGSMFSSAATMVGFAVTPSTTANNAFLSATGIAIGRSAMLLDGGEMRFYLGTAQTVAVDSAVTLTQYMQLTTSGLNVTGTVTATTFSGALSGNATTATTLATARNINGVSFNGSTDITVTAAAGTLSGSTLASGVTASSLTSVGTLTSLSVSGQARFTGTVSQAAASVDRVDIGVQDSTPRMVFENYDSTVPASRIWLVDVETGVTDGLFRWYTPSTVRMALSTGSTYGLRLFSLPLTFGTDNNADIGQSGANRPRTGYFATSVVIGIDPGGASALRVGGDVRIGSGSLGVGVDANPTDGRVDAGNDIVAYSTSDPRLKTNLEPITGALATVSRLRGWRYQWRQEPELKQHHGYDETPDLGVMADEVEEVLPQIVQHRANGFKAVRYERLIPVLIEAIKELQQEVAELRAGRSM